MSTTHSQDSLSIMIDWLIRSIRMQITDAQETISRNIKKILGTITKDDRSDIYITQDFIDSLLKDYYSKSYS